MIEFRLASDRLPSTVRVAIFARNVDCAVRIVRSRCLRRCVRGHTACSYQKNRQQQCFGYRALNAHIAPWVLGKEQMAPALRTQNKGFDISVTTGLGDSSGTLTACVPRSARSTGRKDFSRALTLKCDLCQEPMLRNGSPRTPVAPTCTLLRACR